jgi:hypothetical protein
MQTGFFLVPGAEAEFDQEVKVRIKLPHTKKCYVAECFHLKDGRGWVHGFDQNDPIAARLEVGVRVVSRRVAVQSCSRRRARAVFYSALLFSSLSHWSGLFPPLLLFRFLARVRARRARPSG